MNGEIGRQNELNNRGGMMGVVEGGVTKLAANTIRGGQAARKHEGEGVGGIRG